MIINKKIYNNEILESRNALPITNIEKDWILHILKDEKIGLFLDEESIEVLKDKIGKIKGYFDEDSIINIDKNTFGDNYEDIYYRMNFQEILKGIKEKRVLKIEYFSRNGNCLREEYLPYKLEYNSKENRFKMLAFLMQDERPVLLYKINVSRIQSIAPLDYYYHKKLPIVKLMEARKIDTPIVIATNQPEDYVKKLISSLSKYDSKVHDNVKNVKDTTEIIFKYDRQDEDEVISELLSYGSKIKVSGNANFLEMFIGRLNRQYSLMFGKILMDKGSDMTCIIDNQHITEKVD